MLYSQLPQKYQKSSNKQLKLLGVAAGTAGKTLYSAPSQIPGGMGVGGLAYLPQLLALENSPEWHCDNCLRGQLHTTSTLSPLPAPHGPSEAGCHGDRCLLPGELSWPQLHSEGPREAGVKDPRTDGHVQGGSGTPWFTALSL